MGDDTRPGEEGLDEENTPPNGGSDAPPALKVIGAFGGIRPMASKLDVPVSTVQGWKERGVIPEARHSEVRSAAEAHGVGLDEADLAASAEAPPEVAADLTTADVTAAESLGEALGESAAETEEAAAEAALTDGGEPGNGQAEETEPASASESDAEAAPAEPSSVTPPPADSPIPAAAQQGGRHGWVSGFILGALVLAVGAGGAVLTKDIWDPGATGGADLTQQLAALDQRVAEVEARPSAAGAAENLATADDITRLQGEIAALSGAADGSGDLAARLDELSAKLDDLDGRLTAVGDSASAGAEAASALGGLSGDVAAIKGRMDESKTAIEARLDQLSASVDELTARDAGRDALLWSAVGALRDAVRYTGPFADQLADVDRLAGDRAEFQEALAELRPLAAGGVASLSELQREFPAIAREVVAAGYGASDDGVLGDVLNRVSQVVTVRPIGEVEGDSPGAIVARAEDHLDQGDLAAAVEELKGLPEGAGEAAAPWQERAQQRIAADAAIKRLNGLLAGQLAAGG